MPNYTGPLWQSKLHTRLLGAVCTSRFKGTCKTKAVFHMKMMTPVINAFTATNRVSLHSRSLNKISIINLPAICEPIVKTMWDSQHLTTLVLQGLLQG
jgi:hypothetical protein